MQNIVKAKQVARELVKAGAEGNEVVGVMADRSAEYVAVVIGVMKAGCAYMPIAPGQHSVAIEILNSTSFWN